MSFIAKKFIELINDYTEGHVDVEAIEREEHNKNVSDIQESSGFDKNGQYIEKESYVYKGETTNKKKQKIWQAYTATVQAGEQMFAGLADASAAI